MDPIVDYIQFQPRIDGRVSSDAEAGAYYDFLERYDIDPDDILDEGINFRSEVPPGTLDRLVDIYNRLLNANVSSLTRDERLICDSLLGIVDSLLSEIDEAQLNRRLERFLGMPFSNDPPGKSLLKLKDLFCRNPLAFVQNFNDNFEQGLSTALRPYLEDPRWEREGHLFLLTLVRSPEGLRLSARLIEDMYLDGEAGKRQVARLLIGLNNPALVLEIIDLSGIELNDICGTISAVARNAAELQQASRLAGQIRGLDSMLGRISYRDMDNCKILEYKNKIIEYFVQYYDEQVSYADILTGIQRLPYYKGSSWFDQNHIGSTALFFDGSRAADKDSENAYLNRKKNKGSASDPWAWSKNFIDWLVVDL